MRSTARMIALLALAAPKLGCGGGGPPLVPVSGVVTVDGEPLAGATIIYTPTDGDETAVDSGGQTDASGRYVLKTSSNREGAIVGTHNVTVSPPMVSQTADAAATMARENTDIVELDPNDADDAAEGATYMPGGRKDDRLRVTQFQFVVPPGGTDQANLEMKAGR